MKYKIWKLYFKTGLRIGTGRLDQVNSGIYADSFYSALVNEAAKIGREMVDELIEATKAGSLVISDLFPFIDSELTLPKPIITIQSETTSSKEKKAFKDIDYIPLSLWEDYMGANSDPDQISEILAGLGKSDIITKISHKDSGDHDIYNLAFFRFNKDSGLYFILGYKNEAIYDLLDEIIWSLSFTGIGGKKNVGLGKFDFEEMEKIPQNLESRLISSGSKMLLSTSFPSREELEEYDLQGSYALVRRGGFSYSEDKRAKESNNRRKKTMYYFKAGSVLEQSYKGGLFIVDEDFVHPIYRYGKGMWMEI